MSEYKRSESTSYFSDESLELTIKNSGKPIIIYVEGNIGAGKTTMMPKFMKSGWCLYAEPVAKWRQLGLLDAYYKKPSRWGYTFQNYAILTRILRIDDIAKKCGGGDVVFVERSSIADRHIFMKIMSDKGYLTDMEINIYDEYADELVKKFNVFNTDIYDIGFIYLRTKWEVCKERIMERNRSEECNIPDDYLKKLEKMHDDIFRKKIPKDITNNILILNNSSQLTDAIQNKMRVQVCNFVEKMQQKK